MVGPPHSPTVEKCSERRVPDPDSMGGCCQVIPCRYCLEWDVYGEPLRYGTATLVIDRWLGTVDGYDFEAYWERPEYSEQCQFVVLFDGVEISRVHCGDYGVSCRDASGDAEATVLDGYIPTSGRLTWRKDLPRPLPMISDPETGLRVPFCGGCSCTCNVLCVLITGGTADQAYDISYTHCEVPTWENADTSLTLAREEYTGACLIGGTVAGEPVEWQAVPCGQSLAASWTLYDGRTASVFCQDCGSCESVDTVPTPCAPVPFPRVLYASFETGPDCALCAPVIPLVTSGINTGVTWEGIANSCIGVGGGLVNWTIRFRCGGFPGGGSAPDFSVDFVGSVTYAGPVYPGTLDPMPLNNEKSPVFYRFGPYNDIGQCNFEGHPIYLVIST